jgi:hypothetical protein
MKKIASVVILAAVLLGAGIAPAHAAGDDVVTITGHVRDDDGDPLTGIKVSGGCQCGFEGPAPAYSGTTVKTSAGGYFSFKLLRKYANYISFEDPKDRYLTGTAMLKKRGGRYTGNKTLHLASEVAGTIRDDAGKPAKQVEVKFYDAVTGKRVREQGEGMTDRNGHFHALVPGGSYKIRISGINNTFAAEWYGDSPTRAASPIVTVTRGGKTAGINGTLTKQLRIVGQVKLQGEKRVFGNGDQIRVRAKDAAGTVLMDDFAEGYFFVQKLQPGTYTLEFYPTGSNFFVPQTVSYTLAPDTSLENAKVVLVPIPASSTDKRNAAFAWGSPPSRATKGELYSADFEVWGYGDVVGGTVTLFADGKKLDTAKVPASGKITLKTRFAGVSAGTYPLVLAFSGTETTLPTEFTSPINVKVSR